MHSCIYSGTVRHRRFHPVHHQFQYRLFQMYVDLDELPAVFDPFPGWSARRPAIAWFRRGDHLGSPDEPLQESVRQEVFRQTGERPTGPIRLLTNLRYLGYVINPVSYYYCFDSMGVSLTAVLAEVHNTPWGERHCYVLRQPVRQASGTARSVWMQKEFHVSPFMKMQKRYRWHLTVPDSRLLIHIESHDVPESDGVGVQMAEQQPAGSGHDTKPARIAGKPFDVTLMLRRQSLSNATLTRALLSHPAMTIRVAAAIYWQAFRLWAAGVPFVPHPRRRRMAEPTRA